MGSSGSYPRVSIIIPVRYRADLLRVTLDSIRAYTGEAYELIIVREGDEPGVGETLKEQDIGKVVRHTEPRGYPAAINAGFRLAAPDAELVLLLNSDVVCTPGWLTEMARALEAVPDAGLVAPTYSEAAGIQSVNRNERGVDHSLPEFVKGACLLLRRKTCDELVRRDGWILDEGFGLGGGEDADLCIRIRRMGLRVVVARRSFIYHYNSASFRELFDNDIPRSRRYAAAQFRRFREKWRDSLGERLRIYVAIPCLDGFLHHRLAIRLVQWSHDPALTVKIVPYPHLAPLDHCRNQAVKDMLEDDWDFLCFVDNDIIPPPECLRELVAADRDVIAPVCLTMKPGDDGIQFPMPVAHRQDGEGRYRPHYGTGIEETDVVTGGMHLVRREVYERMDRPYAFSYHANGTVTYSEDFWFSRECKRLGYKLYTHYGLLCGHVKGVDVKGINDLMVKYGR